jgi:hypothetical protein
MQNPG